MIAHTVLEKSLLWETLKHWPTKKAAKKDGASGLLLAVSFGLWGIRYVERSTSGLVCRNGEQMPFHIANLHSGSVIGRRDLAAAKGQTCEEAWHASLSTRIAEELNLPN